MFGRSPEKYIYLESKINSCKGEIKTDLHVNGLPLEKAL